MQPYQALRIRQLLRQKLQRDAGSIGSQYRSRFQPGLQRSVQFLLGCGIFVDGLDDHICLAHAKPLVITHEPIAGCLVKIRIPQLLFE